MRLEGYDAKTMTKVLAAIDSINPLNGIVTQFVDYETERLLIAANFLWADEDGDLFEDYALQNWRRETGGDVRALAEILNLDVEIKL